jgi:STAS domain
MKPKVGPHVVILDLSRVTFVTSEAMGRLLGLRKTLLAMGGKLLICNADKVMSIFEVPGIRQVLNICAGEAEATGPEEGPICPLTPAGQTLDGPATTELENRYERWWYGGGKD